MGQSGSAVPAPRTSCTGSTPNNLPPLTFHRVHGDNIRISRDGYTARRVESFCKGVAFSARPVRVNEKVCIRFVEISNNWSGVLRFGFTTHDPCSLTHCLPKYACPDLTNKPGNWAKALGERFCEKDNLLYYYVNAAGDVHFGINGEDKGVFFTGVDTRNPLWSLVDVYGNCTAIQYADPRAPAQARRSLPGSLPGPGPEDGPGAERLAGSLRSLSLEEGLPPPRYLSQPVQPLTLHRTKGRNVHFVSERGVAARLESEFCQGYVFSARPLQPGETLLVQVLGTEPAYAGSLALGLTSCDPGALRPADLPDDAEQLLDRPEYWVVRRDAAAGLRRGDELAVTLTPAGELRLSRNGCAPLTVLHVDHTLRLWAFVDIYGATQKVRLLSAGPRAPPALAPAPTPPAPAPAAAPSPGAVLVVSLPPAHHAALAARPNALALASAHYIEPIQASTQQLCLSGLSSLQSLQGLQSLPPPPPPRPRDCLSAQNSHNEAAAAPPPCAAPPPHAAPPPCAADPACPAGPSSASTSHGLAAHYELGNLTGQECTICYENPIDSVLYMCGHMCMCYRCAVQQWRGKGGGQCPLCRAPIKDVIRTYKS